MGGDVEDSNVEHGFSSPLWMAKAVVSSANAGLLRIAVCNVLDRLWSDGSLDVEQVFERIVQISSTGRYREPHFTQEDYEEAVKIADDIAERNIDEEVAKFREQLDNLGEEDEDGDVG